MAFLIKSLRQNGPKFHTVLRTLSTTHVKPTTRPFLMGNSAVARSFTSGLPVDVKEPQVVRTNYAEKESEIASLQREIRGAMRIGDYEAAQEAAKSACRLTLDHFGDEHPVYASSLNNLALIHKNLGQFEDAVEVYERALQVYKKVVGEKHASFAMTLSNLGLVYRTMAQSSTPITSASQGENGDDAVTRKPPSAFQKLALFEQALDCFKIASEIREEVLTRDHPDLGMSLCNLGTTYWHLNRGNEAVDTLKQAVDMLTKHAGVNHPFTATAMNNLAFVYKGMEKYDDAVDIYKQVVDIRTELLGPEHHDTITVQHNLAEAYRAAGQEDKAVAIQEKLLQIFEQQE